MPKLIIKGIVMVALAAGIGNYILYVKTGKSPLGMENIFGNGSGTAANPVSTLLDNTSQPKKETVYKWVDENGKTHYGEAPPELDESKAEKIVVNPNKNIIDAPAKAEKVKASTSPATSQDLNYSPERIKQLMDDAKNVENLLNERKTAQDGAIDH